ncbi:hypothetical protein BVRB_2g044220 [Beta vulgaris subsp. vulgaris]|nr:hypothetical protein BVRB_2g044220 [Beta vulgaris subsp. vulgaris]
MYASALISIKVDPLNGKIMHNKKRAPLINAFYKGHCFSFKDTKFIAQTNLILI